MTERTTMRAISQDVLGGPEVLHETTTEIPAPGISEIRVRVHAAGLNPTDWKHRAQRLFLGDPPYVLGWDVSGVVDAVGFGVTLFAPGDRVFGMLPYPHGAGAFAEYVTAPTRAFAHAPSGLSHTEAGALPLAALTAWQALVDTARLQSGQRVLVHAAAGGVGHLAVQIAKARGAHVIGTASAGKHAFLKDLGADELVDYREVDFAEAVSEVDVVLDPICGEYGRRSVSTLRPGGVLIPLLPVPDEERDAAAATRGIRVAPMLVEADHGGMAAIAELVEQGRLRPHVSEVFPLSGIAEAHRRGDEGHTSGKIVVRILD
ncbi:NADP-dependent oxidoreductase [Lipingzhangella sp. LS1_29]|uniref:NADP-dependent oxidoreductase n=1 Tax=Lipingzhangella rawalii TaxID=2055835 RepID=A0ABU2H7J5_9ACTN|nr:NADP-dependent oxidoreductase [Lipingzhangella rawalii]MDS1271286.1 NADP-dependent oxidoreductase [Lipingzhangella rawalii]